MFLKSHGRLHRYSFKLAATHQKRRFLILYNYLFASPAQPFILDDIIAGYVQKLYVYLNKNAVKHFEPWTIIDAVFLFD